MKSLVGVTGFVMFLPSGREFARGDRRSVYSPRVSSRSCCLSVLVSCL
jgi:hypothetical protein